MAFAQEIAKKIIVKGLVQGIGFRPFIYRIAKQRSITGWVENRSDSVLILAQGVSDNIDTFLDMIKNHPPELTKIESIEITSIEKENHYNFSIRESKDLSGNITQISPDIAVCKECLEDLHYQSHRIDYPFINCTLCGPRFSIIKGLPYDRAKTTMKSFEMCDQCRKEYSDISNRRFHAQPVACNHCGPVYTLYNKKQVISDFRNVLVIVRDLILQGKIIAIKGIGGFHLACNAFDEEAFKRLRAKKKRDHKPFAMMFSNLDSVKKYASVSRQEEIALVSSVRPIVLLKMEKELIEEINSGLNTIGVMLPYMPIHHMLFAQTGLPAMVFTSGNFSDEPIVIHNERAKNSLTDIADAVLTHNRKIYNRVDDSVITVMNNKVRIIRRSRGFVPSPIPVKLAVEGIIAAGAELKNCFALGKENNALVSQHIGDLKNLETYEYYCETINRFKQLFRVTPEIIACDMHPDYLSTRYSMESGLFVEKVQHHHAHIASCMAEHGIDEKIIGVSLDGTGYGEDNTVWGGEFLLCDLSQYERYSHLETVPMPGGDKAAEEPWRMAVSYLLKVFGNDFLDLSLDLVSAVPREQIEMAILSIEKKVNSPLTSSTGRLFDAVSSLLGICHFHTFEAEGAMRLESFIDNTVKDIYNFVNGECIETGEIVKGLVEDFLLEKPKSYIAAKFHNTVIRIVHEVVLDMRKETGIKKVVLSGGTFQNRFLFTGVEKMLVKSGLTVYSHENVPCNDGGIALGQLVVAAKRRELACV